jgi:hypothetical protein
MAAKARQRGGSGWEGAPVRLLAAVLVPLSAAEEEALVEVLALALLPLLVSEGSATPAAAIAGEAGLEGGERG